jgi:hypothetical protein
LRRNATQVFNEIHGVKRRVSSPGIAMSNRTAKFVSAMFASILAGANFVAVAENVAKTEDACLSGPKGPVPAGGHWYYRIDRTTKRHCWYLGDEKAKTAQGARQDSPVQDSSSLSSSAPLSLSPSAANPVPPQNNPAVSRSIADAHAELPPQAPADQGASVNVEQQTGAAANAPDPGNGRGAAAPDAAGQNSVQSSVIVSRWPESSGVSSADNPPPAATGSLTASQPAPAAAPSPDATPVALAAADSSPERQSGSMQMLLMVMIGALALAGLIGSLIFRLGRARAPRYRFRNDRRGLWDSIPADRASPSIFPNQEVPRRRADLPRDPRAPDDPERRIAEMLARLSRTAAT